MTAGDPGFYHSLAFLRLPRSCAGVAHGIQLQYAIATAHPPTGPFSPETEHGWGEKGPVGGLVEAHGFSRERAPPRHKTGAAVNQRHAKQVVKFPG